jgi:hypothetical protein
LKAIVERPDAGRDAGDAGDAAMDDAGDASSDGSLTTTDASFDGVIGACFTEVAKACAADPDCVALTQCNKTCP